MKRKPLTPDEIRILIVLRLESLQGNCNSFHTNHVEGQLRGLLAALGCLPPYATGDACQVLRDAEIPFAEDGETYQVDEDWCRRMGFANPETEGLLKHWQFPEHW